MSKFFIALLLTLGGSALTSMSPLAWAADVETVAEPTVKDRLDTARASIRAGDYKRALSELNIAARSEPRNADVHNLLGYATRKQAAPNVPKAIEHYQTALRLDPSHKGAHEYIGEAYLMQGNAAQAEKHLADLARICGNTTCEEYADLAKAIGDFKAKPAQAKAPL